MSSNNQINKGALTNLKGFIYIYVVSIQGTCLKLLQVACASCLFHLYLYLLLWGSCLKVTLVSISTFTSSIVPACSIPSWYVLKFVWCASMFNSFRICARVLSVLTQEGVLGEWSTGDDKGELIGEHYLLEILATLGRASKLGKKNLLRSLVILTYEEVFEDVWSIGEYFLFLHGLLGNLCWL